MASTTSRSATALNSSGVTGTCASSSVAGPGGKLRPPTRVETPEGLYPGPGPLGHGVAAHESSDRQHPPQVRLIPPRPPLV